MDAATRASLEIHRARDGGTLHTLLGTVQRTLTPAGRATAGGLARRAADRHRGDRCAPGCLGMAAGERDAADPAAVRLRTAPDIARALGRLSVESWRAA